MEQTISEQKFWDFSKEVRGMAPGLTTDSPWTIPALAYAALLKRGWTSDTGPIDSDIVDFLQHIEISATDLNLSALANEYTEEELIAMVLSDYWVDIGGKAWGDFSTPSSIADLAIKLLAIDEGNLVADLGSGAGSFMVRVHEKGPRHKFYGLDINYLSVIIARMRASILGFQSEIIHGDLFDHSKKCDRFFIQPPLGMTIQALEKTRKVRFESFLPAGVWGRSADWFYILKALGDLKQDGRAVAVIPGGPLFNAGDALIRQHAVLKRMIRAVISLPEGMLYGTGILVNLLLLGHHCDGITFVDATDLGIKERRRTLFTPDDINEVLRRVNNPDGIVSISMQMEDIASKDWPLNPGRYLSAIRIKNGIPLKSLVAEIARGANIPAKELDKRMTTDKTPYRYLMIKDVVDGEISSELPYLTELKPGENRHCLNDGDIVLGKMSPFKIAVAHLAPGEHILCTGNLYIIRPDYGQVSPEYLRLFLESDAGFAQLKAACVGTTIPTVPVRALENIQIPRLSKEEQERIETEIKAIQDEIELYKIKIEKAQARAASLIPQGD